MLFFRELKNKAAEGAPESSLKLIIIKFLLAELLEEGLNVHFFRKFSLDIVDAYGINIKAQRR